MKTVTIPKKQLSGSIYDISSALFDRIIKFRAGCRYAIVSASYYGGRGYKTYKSETSAIRASRSSIYSHQIIDDNGCEQMVNYDELIPRNNN